MLEICFFLFQLAKLECKFIKIQLKFSVSHFDSIDPFLVTPNKQKSHCYLITKSKSNNYRTSSFLYSQAKGLKRVSNYMLANCCALFLVNASIFMILLFVFYLEIKCFFYVASFIGSFNQCGAIIFHSKDFCQLLLGAANSIFAPSITLTH